MAKPTSPLLSLGAKGTIGDALTYQKRNQTTIVRKKPIPKDPYSLAQAYQRWLYQDYAYLWTQQSEATKRQYASSAVRYHLTGFQYWMKYQLANLPDIAGWWKLDINTGPTTPDSSRNVNTGTLFGPSPAIGIIDKALSFDGINDKIDLGNHITLFPSAFTYEAWINHSAFVNFAGIIMAGYNEGTNKGGLFFSHADKSLHYAVLDGTDQKGVSAYNAFTATGTWYHVAAIFDGTNLALYVNGLLKGTNTQDPVVYDTAIKAWIGCRKPNYGFFHGIIDHAIIYNRALDATEIKRHSLRRYPP